MLSVVQQTEWYQIIAATTSKTVAIGCKRLHATLLALAKTRFNEFSICPASQRCCIHGLPVVWRADGSWPRCKWHSFGQYQILDNFAAAQTVGHAWRTKRGHTANLTSG